MVYGPEGCGSGRPSAIWLLDVVAVVGRVRRSVSDEDMKTTSFAEGWNRDEPVVDDVLRVCVCCSNHVKLCEDRRRRSAGAGIVCDTSFAK